MTVQGTVKAVGEKPGSHARQLGRRPKGPQVIKFIISINYIRAKKRTRAELHRHHGGDINERELLGLRARWRLVAHSVV